MNWLKSGGAGGRHERVVLCEMVKREEEERGEKWGGLGKGGREFFEEVGEVNGMGGKEDGLGGVGCNLRTLKRTAKVEGREGSRIERHRGEILRRR